jgi:hypothetical protein
MDDRLTPICEPGKPKRVSALEGVASQFAWATTGRKRF